MRSSRPFRLAVCWFSTVLLFFSAQLYAEPVGQLQGKVEDANGSAVRGLDVTLWVANNKVAVARTEKDGSYQFDDLKPGSYVVAAEHADLGQARSEVEIRRDAIEQKNLRLAIVEAEAITVSLEIDNYFQTDRLSSKTGVLTSLQDTPNAISIISEKLIADQSADNFGDLTKNVAGLTTRGTYYGGYVRINLRGFSLDEREGFYRNGIKIYQRGALVVDNLERVEILKGPASVLANDIAPGGLINLVTKRPLQDRLLSLDAIFDSEGQRKIRLDYNRPDLGDVASFRINGSYENSETFVDEIENERLFVAPAARFQPTTSTSITADMEIDDFTGTVSSGLFAPPASLEDELIAVYGVDRLGFLDLQDESTFLGEPGADYDWQKRLFQLNVDHVFGGGKILQAIASYSEHDRDVYGVTLESFVNDDPSTGLVERGDGFPGDSGFFLSDQTTTGLQLNVQGLTTTGSVDNTWMLGADWEDRERNFPLRGGEVGPIDIFNPVYTNDFVLDGSDITVFTADSRYGVFAQNNFAFGNGLNAVLGLRYSQFNNDRSERAGVNSPNRTDHNEVTYRAGLAYTPQNSLGTTLYASYNTSFLPVDAVPQSGLPDPVPIEGEQVEVGVKQTFLGGRLFAQLSYYDISQENLVVGFRQRSQIGAVTTKGYELEIVGKASERLNMVFNIATNDRENPDGVLGFRSRIASDTPDVTANLWLTYNVNNRLVLGGGGEFIDDRPIPTGGGQVFVPSYEKFDLFARYQIRPDLGLQLNLENITDERYYVGQQVFNGTGVIVGAPANARLTVSYRP